MNFLRTLRQNQPFLTLLRTLSPQEKPFQISNLNSRDLNTFDLLGSIKNDLSQLPPSISNPVQNQREAKNQILNLNLTLNEENKISHNIISNEEKDLVDKALRNRSETEIRYPQKINNQDFQPYLESLDNLGDIKASQEISVSVL